MQILRSSQENVNLESYTPQISPNQNPPEPASRLMKQASELQQQNIEESQNLILIASSEQPEEAKLKEKIEGESLSYHRQVLVEIKNGNFKLRPLQVHSKKKIVEYVPEAVGGLKTELAQRILEQARIAHDANPLMRKQEVLEIILETITWNGPLTNQEELKKIIIQHCDLQSNSDPDLHPDSDLDLQPNSDPDLHPHPGPKFNPFMTFLDDVEQKVEKEGVDLDTAIQQSAEVRVESMKKQQELSHSPEYFQRMEESRKQQTIAEEQSQEELFKEDFVPRDKQVIKDEVPVRGWVVSAIQGFNNLWS